MIVDQGRLSAYGVLSEVLADRTGLTFAPFSRQQIATRIDRAMRRCRAQSAEELLACLGRDPEELDELLLELTVGETYFFRDAQQFDLLRHTILPEIAQAHDGPLRIWSAGCATGEEPYSLAILLDQLGLGERARILATDICRGRLALAARGQYGSWSFRQMDQSVVRRYFTRTGGVSTLDPRIRERVAFQPHNLAAAEHDPLPSIAPADLVVCRNVLIYLRPEAVRLVARRLLAALRPGGWLVLGASDPFVGDDVPCEVITTDAGLVYRAPHTAPQAAPRTAARPAPRPALAPVALERAPERVREGSAAAMVVRATPHDPASSVAERIRTMIRQGDLADAGRACAAALDQHRVAPALHYLHAILLVAAGHLDEAIVAARRVVYLERTSPLGHLALARARLAQGDAEGARRAYAHAERALALLPPDHPLPAVEGETASQVLGVVRLSLGMPG